MAVKASNSITLTSVIDVKATYRYYLLQSSTLTAPSRPTTFPPIGTWDDTEPSYTDGSTNSLYFCDCTVFSDDTFSYSEVSLSSSYEAAKAAYNAAVSASNTAKSAMTTANGKNTVFYQTSAPSASGRKVNDVWFDTDDNNKMYYWSGSAWTAQQFGTNAIAANAITANLLAASAITAGKIASGAVTTDKLYALSVTAEKIAGGAITTDKLAANAVTAGKIAANAVTASTIAAKAVTTDKIAVGAVSADKIVANAITSDKIVSSAVTTDKLAANAVTANKILAGAVTTDKLAANAVTAAKIDVTDLFAQDITATGTINGNGLTIGGDSTFTGIINATAFNFGQTISGTTYSIKCDESGMRFIAQLGDGNIDNFTSLRIYDEAVIIGPLMYAESVETDKLIVSSYVDMETANVNLGYASSASMRMDKADINNLTISGEVHMNDADTHLGPNVIITCGALSDYSVLVHDDAYTIGKKSLNELFRDLGISAQITSAIYSAWEASY